MHIKIGTRGSKLAMMQTGCVCECLKAAYPEDIFEIVVISTKGDRVQDVALNQIGDKGLFVREIEEQLLCGEIQMGVHSMKDMPSECEDGLMFTKAWKREDPRDVLVLREKKNLNELEEGAVIGTGSLRRGFQLQMLRPDLKIVDIRGNVDTRLRKMEEQKLDGIVLAAAGLHRLGMQDVITQYLEPEQMISACAQGALALEIKSDNEDLREMLDALSDEKSHMEVVAERTFLAEMEGSCHVPVGASCKIVERNYTYDAGENGILSDIIKMRDAVKSGNRICKVCGIFGTEDGSKLIRAEAADADPVIAGKKAAAEIKKNMAELPL